MITEEQFQELKQKHEQAKSKAERAKGALAQLMQQLKEEFGCTSVKQAQTALAKLQKERDEAEEEFNKSLKAYEKKWKED